jgi:hypothetical protein
MSHDQLPPPILYSYSAGGDWLPACLAGLSLKFSSRADFNDPFDSRPAYQVDPSVTGRQFLHDKLKRNFKMPPGKRLRQLGDLHRYARILRPFTDIITDQFLDSVGILCLTEEWDQPLFWGHYGAKHTGICIGFRTDRDVFQIATKVIYQPDLPVILRPHDSNDEMVRKALLTKSSAWAGEKEWRIIKHKRSEDQQRDRLALLAHLDADDARMLADQQGVGIYRFNPTAVESITMGMFISSEHEARVIEAVKAAPEPIHLYKVSRHRVKYKIDRTWVRVRR